MATVIRRRFNRVNALKDDENMWCMNTSRIKHMVVNHFQSLFSEEGTTTSPIGMEAVDFPRLSQHHVQTLQEPFTKQDISFALKGMQPLKAPGPDGFHAYFFMQYWHIIEDDVCNVVLQALQGQPMPSGLNDTFITLIPKVPNLK